MGDGGLKVGSNEGRKPGGGGRREVGERPGTVAGGVAQDDGGAPLACGGEGWQGHGPDTDPEMQPDGGECRMTAGLPRKTITERTPLLSSGGIGLV